MTIHQLVDAPKSRVIVGDEGVTVSFDDERRLTVRWDECTAAVTHDDGRRVLYGADGFRIVLDPAQWVRGDVLAAALDRLVPAHVVVPATVDEPGVPEPGGPPSPVTFAPPAWRPHIPWWRLHGLSTWILALAAVPLALFTLLCATIVLFGPTMDDRAVGSGPRWSWERRPHGSGRRSSGVGATRCRSRPTSEHPRPLPPRARNALRRSVSLHQPEPGRRHRPFHRG